MVLQALVVILVGFGTGQAQVENAPARDRAISEALLAEVRALRADLQTAARISVGTQLVTARLQLQEQRVNAVAAQLSDLRRRIAQRQSDEADLAERIKRFDGALRSGTHTAEEQRELESGAAGLKQQLERMQADDQDLRTQESDLAGRLTGEQSRWMEFNSRLDELERQLGSLRRPQ